jgi:hypothetical protein
LAEPAGQQLAAQRMLHLNLFEIEFWQKNLRVLGLAALVIGVGAWVIELSGAVYVCPYCRIQRSVIAILGLFMLLPITHHWITKYLSISVGFLGAVVAVNQNFMGWLKISKGEFTPAEPWYFDPFLLSGGSLFIIVAQVCLISMAPSRSSE